MRRREFVAGLTAAAWPLVARAQEHERMRRIGVFLPGVADDLEIFLQALGELGWTVGRNLRITHRRGAGDVERYRAIAAELVALSPDLIMALGSATATAVQKITRT